MFMRFGLAHRQAFSIIVLEPTHSPMDKCTSGNGRTAKDMAKAPSHLAKANGRETSTSGNLRTANSMAKAPTHMPMETSTSGN